MRRGGMFLVMLALMLMFSGVVRAEGTLTIEDAFKNGFVSGEIGTYIERRDNDGAANYGWGTAYATVKYVTDTWNNLEAGIRFFAHGEIYNQSDNGTDYFDSDIEKKVTLPELYLSYGFGESSNVTAGRFANKGVAHLDDTHSEGAYVQFKEIEDLTLTAGFMRRFAEIDYDDSEDFGRTGDQQDLNSTATYGAKADSVLGFVEAKYKILDAITLNPYYMRQGGYASVLGIDTKAEFELEAVELKYGASLELYQVYSDIVGSSDSFNIMIAPFVGFGPVNFIVGYVDYDEGDSLNKPAWFNDPLMSDSDQVVGESAAGAEAIFTKLKLSLGNFWTHVAYVDYGYDMGSNGDGAQEAEWQLGYKFTKSLDAEIRLFDVKYDNVDNKDYKKIEARVRFKF